MEIQGEDVKEELQRIENNLYLISKPEQYGGKKGLIIKIEKDFEGDSIILQQNGIQKPKKSTVVEFYRAIQIIEKQNKNGKSKRSKRNNS